MPWAKAQFKGKTVFAEVDESNNALVMGGRVAIRYSAGSNATIYRAGADSVQIVGTTAQKMEGGVLADNRSKKTTSSRGSGFGSAKTRTSQQAAMAAESARTMLASLPATSIIAYTDGGTAGNPGESGSGAVINLPDGRIVEMSKYLGHGTNNIAELSAIGLVLNLLDDLKIPTEQEIAILSDSSYTNGVLTRGWKAKANRELISGLKAQIKERPNLTIHWVAGHAGIAGNERADELATQGVRGVTDTREIQPDSK